MPDRIPALMTLLEDLRHGQAAGNQLLHDVRVSVAGLERSHEGQGQQLARIEATVDALSDRVRYVEISHARLPQLERELAGVEERVKISQETANRRHTDLDTRVRALEGDGKVTNATVGAGREIFWRLFTAGAGFAAALILQALRT